MSGTVVSIVLASLFSSAQPLSLPEGNAPVPVRFPHFPDRTSAFVWRNWSLVPVERMAKVISARPADILRIGKEMGLPDPQAIPDSRIGFEASNQYNYIPLDLVEKVVNCRDLLDNWLPAQRKQWVK